MQSKLDLHQLPSPFGGEGDSSTGKSSSVPAATHRQVVNELHATRLQLEALKQYNQELLRENQQLKTEARTVVTAIRQLEQAIESFNPTDGIKTLSPAAPVPERSEAEPVEMPPEPVEMPPQPLERLPESEGVEPETEPVIEEESEPYQINGWWIMGVILAVTVAFSGWGYAIVRPLLEEKSPASPTAILNIQRFT